MFSAQLVQVIFGTEDSFGKLQLSFCHLSLPPAPPRQMLGDEFVKPSLESAVCSKSIIQNSTGGFFLFAARSEINFYLQAHGGRAIKSKQREVQTETALKMFGKSTARSRLVREESLKVFQLKSPTQGWL